MGPAPRVAEAAAVTTSARALMILETVQDLVLDFVYYDRKGDEDLGVGEIEDAVAKGQITVDQIVGSFRRHLETQLRAQGIIK